jgi:hypothetical protein
MTNTPEKHENSFDWNEVLCASDASSTGWGFIIFDKKSGNDYTESGVYRDKDLDWHIFVKEFLTAKLAIEKAVVRAKMSRPDNHTRVVIAVDNSAAAQVLRNLFSTNTFTMKEVQALNSFLKIQNASVEVINVRSKDNAADEPSRGKDTDVTKRNATISCIKLGRQGLRPNQYDPEDAPGWSQDRQDRGLEPEDDEESLEEQLLYVIDQQI